MFFHCKFHLHKIPLQKSESIKVLFFSQSTQGQKHTGLGWTLMTDLNLFLLAYVGH